MDHVLIELRAAGDNTQVLASRTALLQRDGDVVDADGSSPVSMTAPTGNYYVVVGHRNHLSCMTAAPIGLGSSSTAVDFSSPSTLTYGTNARNTNGAVRVLWAGDATVNDVVQYTGAGNDRDPILTRIGGTVPTNTVSGYYTEDINLDGLVKYTGADNDRDPVLATIGGTLPTAVRVAQLP